MLAKYVKKCILKLYNKYKEEKDMKKILKKVTGSLIAAIPVMATFAMIVSANNVASPRWGQPTPPNSLKKYRKF